MAGAGDSRKSADSRLVLQQGLNLLPQDLIARTRLRQECVTFGQGLLQGRVVDVGDRQCRWSGSMNLACRLPMQEA